MESQYYEHLVRCKPQVLMQVVKVISGIVFVFSLLLMMSSAFIGLVGCIVAAVIFWFSSREVGKDYEYVYIDGDISFDAIYNKSRRKTKGKTSWDETRLVCKKEAPELEGYRQKNASVQDFTSNDKNARGVYAIVTDSEGKSTITYFEPSEEILEMMWRKGPSKVKR